MKLNDELFELGKNSNGICKIVDNNHVLVSKKMPVSDNKLKSYIDSISQAKEDGINICSILDYKLIDGTTSYFDNGEIAYTKGVFIEDRAKGNSFYFKQFYLNEDEKKEIIEEYMNSIKYYIEELEKRSEADISVYDKLIEDVTNLSKYGLEVDPKPLNFFFDEDLGYTIIDVIPMTRLGKNEFFPQYIKAVVFGYGISHLYLDNNDISMMPQGLYERYSKAKKILVAKVETSLLKHGFKEEELTSFNSIREEKEPTIVDYVDVHDYVDAKIDEHKGYKL